MSTDTAVIGEALNDDVYVCPASLPQQGLWFLDRLNPGSAAYNIVNALRLTGPVDWTLMQQAVDAVVARHESLRTTFAMQDGRLVQVIHPHLDVPIRTVSVDGPDAEARAERMAREEAARGFDLAAGPLVRLTAITCDEQRHIFLLVVHHIASDGWSQIVLLEEIGTIYGHLIEQRDVTLPPVPIQYADYCAWQEQRLRPEVIQAQLDYWKSRLAGAPEVLELATDFPRPTTPSGLGKTIWSETAGDVLSGLRELARAEGATMFMVLLAALDVLLARHSGQTDIVVGSPITGRSRPELERVVGFFANTTVVRADLGGAPTFREAIRRVKASAVGAYAHQDVSFHQVVDAVQPDRVGAHNPVFQVMCVVLRVPDSLMALPGVTVEAIPMGSGTAKFDLLVDFSERSDDLLVGFEYSTDLFEPATAARMAERLQHLLRSVVEKPDIPVADLPLLLDEEVEQLRAWNATSRPLPDAATVVQLIERAAESTPDARAVVAGDGVLSYAELITRTRQFRAHLQAEGVGPGELVGICLDRSLDMLVAVLGVMDLGAAYLPLDPAFPAERLAFMVEDAGVRHIVTSTQLAETAPQASRRIVVDQERSVIGSRPAQRSTSAPSATDRAYVLYTSGSTGRPKGVQIPHRALVNFLLSMQQEPGFTRDDRLLAVTTLSFDIAGLELYLPLISGGQVVIASREQAADPSALAGLLTTHDISVLQATPATWRLLLDSGWTGKKDLRILCGGEAMTRELADRLLTAGAEVWNLYGPTETTIWSAVERITPTDKRITIGRPIANTTFHIVDAALRPVPLGVVGELLIGGAGLAIGYLNRDELTAERFVADPIGGEPHGRLYRTGDRARFIPDGRVEWLGRNDHQVKVRGYRIELGEIEAVLDASPDVKQAVVVVHEPPGHDPQLVAYVVPAASNGTGSTGHDVVRRWKDVWDQAYNTGERHDEASDPTFDISGWRSSYTGAQIPAPEMREWVDNTISRLLALRPKRVLEIGCGTGLLLHRLAPHVDSYTGLDLVEGAVSRLRQQAAQRGLTNVTLHVSPADEAAKHVDGQVDLVILNSVVQYFPSDGYLSGVIANLLPRIETGGHIYLGDVRNLDLAEAFHASVATAQLPDSAPIDDVRALAAERLAHEAELLLAPAWFGQLRDQHPEITHVSLEPKAGTSRNEMTMFRYDATLTIGTFDRPQAGVATTIDGSRLSADELRHRLAAHDGPVRVNGIVDPRPLDAIRLASRLREEENGPEPAHSSDVPAETLTGIEPDEVKNLGGNRTVRLELSATPGRYDATYSPNGEVVGEPAWASTGRRDPARLANRPFHVEAALAASLKATLAERLPGYMVPSTFVVLDSLPLTPNGKVDRNALPAPPTTVARQSNEAAVAPVTDSERRIAAIWTDVLGLSEVGTRDNFFQIGGHSMAALRVFLRIEQETGVSLPLSTLFRASTIADLAAILDASTRGDDTPEWSPLVTIKDGNGPTVVGVHSLSGDILEYRLIARHFPDNVRMVGIHAPIGPDVDLDAVFGSIEATAAYYVRELRRAYPQGPYHLCGWSSGGAVALEMAQILRREGAEVGLLAVIDSAPYNIAVPPPSFASKYGRLLANVPNWIRDDLMATPIKTILGRTLHRLRVAFRQITGAARTAPTVRDVVNFPTRSERWERFANTHYRAFRSYVPAPYGGRVSLIVAPTGPLTWINDAETAWRVLTPDVDVYVASGTHFSIVREPHVGSVAKGIVAALSKATST